MTLIIIICAGAIVSGLQPGDPWPEVADSALAAALDTLDLIPEQLDFDRHWATSVHLPDSTVIRAIQHIEELPVILKEQLDLLEDYTLLSPEFENREGLLTLIEILEQADSTISAELIGLGSGLVDTLMAAVPSIWLNEESPLEWDSVLEDWGLPRFEETEMEMDTLASLFERWNFSLNINLKELVLASGSLKDAQWPDELQVTLPGVLGTTVSFCFDGPVRWVIGGRGTNIYTEDCPFELIIDLGGNDFYGEGIGGAVGPAGKRISVVVDLAGDDNYTSDSPVSQGCGLMGLGGVIDLEGSLSI